MRQLLTLKKSLAVALKASLYLATLIGICAVHAQPISTTRIFELPLGGAISNVPLCKGSPLDAQTNFCRFGNKSKSGQTESFDAGINQADLPDWATYAEFNVVTLDERLQAINMRAAHQPEKIIQSLTARFGQPISQSMIGGTNQISQWQAEGVKTRMTCLVAYKVCEVEFQSSEYEAYNDQLRKSRQTGLAKQPVTP